MEKQDENVLGDNISDSLSLDDIFNDSILENNPDEPLWDKLIQQIIDGNVIPIIGTDMLIDNNTNLHKVIIEGIAKSLKLGTKPNSFSELIYAPEYKNRFNIDNIYYQVNKIFAAKNFKPSQRLARLLSIRQFPFVITTSFTPVVETAMRSVWNDELKVMRFNNNPSENDDISNGSDMRKPTVYYMFGKVGEGAHKYVLTDIDMLDFVSSWLSKDNKVRPKNLCNELKDKYLLMLGNEYSNWLFRFVWYSIRKPDCSQGMLVYDDIDEKLVSFLNRADNFTKQNTSDVIDQIISRLKDKLEANEQTKFDKPEENADIFISYSRSDSEIARKLYESLTAHGKRVWYDRNNITEGGNFMEEIRKGIRTAKYFIPIFSSNITKEKDDSHVYRNEWDLAIDIATSMGRTYIIPLANKDFDFYKAAIPEKLQQYNAIFYSDDEDIDQLAEKIIHKINQE